jgi:hypothetical protein
VSQTGLGFALVAVTGEPHSVGERLQQVRSRNDALDAAMVLDDAVCRIMSHNVTQCAIHWTQIAIGQGQKLFGLSVLCLETKGVAGLVFVCPSKALDLFGVGDLPVGARWSGL